MYLFLKSPSFSAFGRLCFVIVAFSQFSQYLLLHFFMILFVCVEVLWPSQSDGVISSSVSLPYHTFSGQA